MRAMIGLLTVVATAAACAGERWEINATALGPDGTPQRYTEQRCLPKGGMDPAHVLGGSGACVFDQKSGTAAALRFVLSCTAPGLPPELAAMKVAGDAHLDGDHFDMHYTVTVADSATLPGADFSLSGSAEARRIGPCEEH